MEHSVKTSVNQSVKPGMQRMIKMTVLLACASVLAVSGLVAAVQHTESATSSNSASIPSVHIVGQRMTQEEKLAFDTQGKEIQTVVINAKRLTVAQKLAFDQQEIKARTVLAGEQGKANIDG